MKVSKLPSKRYLSKELTRLPPIASDFVESTPCAGRMISSLVSPRQSLMVTQPLHTKLCTNSIRPRTLAVMLVFRLFLLLPHLNGP